MFIRLLLGYCVSLEVSAVKYRLNAVGPQMCGSFSSHLDGVMPTVQVITGVDFSAF